MSHFSIVDQLLKNTIGNIKPVNNKKGKAKLSNAKSISKPLLSVYINSVPYHWYPNFVLLNFNQYVIINKYNNKDKNNFIIFLLNLFLSL